MVRRIKKCPFSKPVPKEYGMDIAWRECKIDGDMETICISECEWKRCKKYLMNKGKIEKIKEAKQ